MIKESPRLSKQEDEYTLLDIEQSDESLPTEINTPSEGHTSYFFIELLICSLLLWSLLFIKDTNYGIQFTTIVKQTLQEEIQNQTAQEVIKEVERALKQVL